MSASAALPVLINLGKFIVAYGPAVLAWLVQSGVIRLPAGVTLPSLPSSRHAAIDPAHMALLAATQGELDLDALADHAGDLSRLYLDARSGNLASSV